jgi:DNA-binding beta-propeller fold protein YncE
VNFFFAFFAAIVFAASVVMAGQTVESLSTPANYLSPAALVSAKDGESLFIACATANRVLRLDVTSKQVTAVLVPDSPSGLALSPDGTTLFVTCAAPESKVCVFDTATLKQIRVFEAGHAAMAPVVGLDGKTLFVCNRFDNNVSVFGLEMGREICRIPVRREPVAADLTKDGKFLLVANHLPTGRADREIVTAVISVIDTKTDKVIKEIQLPNGSGSLKDIRVSPDGKFAAVTHIIASFNWAANQVDFGWMNGNALTLLDLAKMEIRYTLLLDEPQRGAANPWGVAWSDDGSKLAVAHAGTHEISLINFQQLLSILSTTNALAKHSHIPELTFVSRYEGMDELTPFLTGARERIALPKGSFGPRALAIIGQRLYVADYFSDSINIIALDAPQSTPETIAIAPHHEMDLVRRGELYFNDATLCKQGWQSCASCHPDGRVDGFNWDLLNDGFGNPKNAKSLLLAHQTPPVMSLGVRGTAETAVRSGIKFILFTKQPEEVPAAMDEYLESLKPIPSPYLVHGKLSDAAKRGEKVFLKAGCADCHSGKLYTDLQPHDVGTRASYDRSKDEFFTPILVEIWRTAPYLHDGSASDIREVLIKKNKNDQHGLTSNLSTNEIDDLCEFVLSL